MSVFYNKTDEEIVREGCAKYNINTSFNAELKRLGKRVTGYILFCKIKYADPSIEKKNSSVISKLWAELDNDVKKIYVLMAKQILDGKPITRKRAPKDQYKQQDKPSDPEHMFKFRNKPHNRLRRETINGKEYILDCFDNIIAVNGIRGDDVGFVGMDKKIRLKI